MEDGHTIWIEKYRPKKLSEIVGQSEIIERLMSYVAAGSLPHLLFTGNAGIGKTTAAVSLAREFFGEEWRMNFRELNASDDRGIDVVRNQVKQFARTSPFGEADFKILFLDEADALTSDAQSALRRTMETYAMTCRFILSCNYSSKIIDPIQSRCAVYRFRPLSNEAITTMIKRIGHEQNLTLSPDIFHAICDVAQGDMRKAINALQGAAIRSHDIKPDMIYEIAATARPDEMKELIDLCISGNFEGAEQILGYLVRDKGIAPQELLVQLYRVVLQSDLPEQVRIQLISHIGETDFRLSEGAHSDIQMEALIAKIVMTCRR